MFNNNKYRIITKKGEIKWIESFVKRFNFEGDDASLISILNITDKIEMEKKLKKSE
ncbi:MAG: hypothetical protein ACFE8N_10350 [Promethearchaeota archaeon]